MNIFPTAGSIFPILSIRLVHPVSILILVRYVHITLNALTLYLGFCLTCSGDLSVKFVSESPRQKLNRKYAEIRFVGKNSIDFYYYIWYNRVTKELYNIGGKRLKSTLNCVKFLFYAIESLSLQKGENNEWDIL